MLKRHSILGAVFKRLKVINQISNITPSAVINYIKLGLPFKIIPR